MKWLSPWRKQWRKWLLPLPSGATVMNRAIFLRQAICGYYAKKNVCLHEDEVFISDGAKSDLGNILDIFSEDNTVLIPDPSYPVYADSNMMAGRNIVSAKGNIENGFLPLPDPEIRPDLIYLCSPSNP